MQLNAKVDNYCPNHITIGQVRHLLGSSMTQGWRSKYRFVSLFASNTREMISRRVRLRLVIEFMSLESIIDEVREKLDKRDEARERIFELTRNAVRLSASAIKAIHRHEFDLAEDNISKIRKTLSEVVDSLTDVPELLHSGMVNTAFQEYTEAALLMILTKESRYAPPEEISVPFFDAYVLGLADLIGELRRSALDSVCSEDVEQAVSILGKMDEVLSNLITLDYPEAIIPGLRHKCDIARSLVEKTRGDIANSVSNQKLVNEIKKLNEKLLGTKLGE